MFLEVDHRGAECLCAGSSWQGTDHRSGSRGSSRKEAKVVVRTAEDVFAFLFVLVGQEALTMGTFKALDENLSVFLFVCYLRVDLIKT